MRGRLSTVAIAMIEFEDCYPSSALRFSKELVKSWAFGTRLDRPAACSCLRRFALLHAHGDFPIIRKMRFGTVFCSPGVHFLSDTTVGVGSIAGGATRGRCPATCDCEPQASSGAVPSLRSRIQYARPNTGRFW